MAAFSRLLPSLTSAFALQTVLAAIFVPQANEMYYDLGGAAGFLSTTCVSLYYPYLRARFVDGVRTGLPRLNAFAPRQLLVTALLGVWSARLGSFLVMRARRAGGDSRFDEVKHQPAKFTAFWMAQASWVFLVGLPVYMVNSLPPISTPPLRVLDYAGLALAGTSFVLEVLADRQKSAWRAAKTKKEHDEKFIHSGLWGISRHPNYVAEVGIWTGIWLLASSSLSWQARIAAGASPFFTWFLLRNVSGVPPLEKSGDKKFAGDKEWEEYKRTVPVFFPWGGFE